MKRLYLRQCKLFALLLFSFNLGYGQTTKSFLLKKGTFPREGITAFFTWQERRTPIYSAHRGGPHQSFPENSLETLKATRKMGAIMFEVDVNMTKDSVLVLMHDKTLDRTTTGKGLLLEQKWEEINKLKLKDDSGVISFYEIPLLDSVLVWAKDEVILSLDVKRGVPFEIVIQAVRKYGLEQNAMLIVYNLQDLKTVHRLAPELMVSVTIRNFEELERVKQTGIPFKKLIAFTGTSISDSSLYAKIHELGSYCILGTMGNLDKKAKSKGTKVYHGFFDVGVDVIAGDLPKLTLQAIRNYN